MGIRKFYTKYGNPYEQAEDQLYALLNNCNAFPEIRNKITGRVLVALPYITEAEWKSKGFDRLPSCPPIIFKDQLGKASLLNKIESTYVTQSGKN